MIPVPQVLALFRTICARTREINDVVRVLIAMRKKGKLDAAPPCGAVALQENDGSEMEEEVDWEQIEGYTSICSSIPAGAIFSDFI